MSERIPGRFLFFFFSWRPPLLNALWLFFWGWGVLGAVCLRNLFIVFGFLEWIQPLTSDTTTRYNIATKVSVPSGVVFLQPCRRRDPIIMKGGFALNPSAVLFLEMSSGKRFARSNKF
ncbi:uncharacterized protein TM35_000271280 [Trypanosoma theileri]|uniref:Uncharacterized protein n=1 Tax=Trypanosoma theileri TaxID=67003 RepID=A0A1X0NPT7_9TRYP|nr:uncharacterized protein TM35_000271280 [Trypanosoma theileri]ORC86538.1 hypothetical protein TM35_000271280 [Trypanosoma theileri]